MFTHKIISKEFQNNILTLVVEFTDGVKVITEGIKPQDEDGFKYWLKQRLASLNSLNVLEKIAINSSINLSEPAPTVAEQEKALWIERDGIKEQVDKAIAKGYLTGTETKVVQLNNWLKTNFKPEYLDLV